MAISLALALVLAFLPIFGVAADGSVVLCGPSETYTSLKDAVAAAADGDTIKLTGDITNVDTTYNKDITIDTNGFHVLRTSSKINFGLVNAGKTLKIMNSQNRANITEQPATYDINFNGNKNSGGIDVSGTLILEYVSICNSNDYVNNQGPVFKISNAATDVQVTGCYLNSAKFAPIFYAQIGKLNAVDSVISGASGAFFAANKNMDTATDNRLVFSNCTLSPIGSTNAANDSSIRTSGANYTYSSINMVLDNSTADLVYLNAGTLTMSGTSAVTSVVAGTNIAAEEGTSLYSDSDYSTAVTAGLVEANTPLYSTVAQAQSSFTMQTGAAVRFNNPTGMRWQSSISASEFEGISAAADEGSLFMGTIIAPADYFAQETLPEVIASTDSEIVVNSKKFANVVAGGFYKTGEVNTIAASVINIKTTNYTREFKAVSYISYTENSVAKTLWAADKDNVRTVSNVAAMALADEQQNPGTYTADQIALLESFIVK